MYKVGKLEYKNTYRNTSWINNSNRKTYEPIHKLNAKIFFSRFVILFLFGQKQLLQNMQSHKNAVKSTMLHNNICSAKGTPLESDTKKITSLESIRVGVILVHIVKIDCRKIPRWSLIKYMYRRIWMNRIVD